MTTRAHRPLVLFATILIGAATCSVGCAVDDTDSSVAAATETDGPLVLDQTNDGGSFAVVEGQQVIVRLPGNPSTGYAWEVTSTDRTFGYPVRNDFVANEEGPVGSGGIFEFVWLTDGFLSMVGSHTVVMSYQRSWEAEPADTFTFTVDIVARSEPGPSCDPTLMCGQAISCVDGQFYPTTCGPANCDEPMGPCDPEPVICGGFAGLTCGEGEYCHYEIDATCGYADATGTCELLPEACAEIWSPVCGCDGNNYENECSANAAGTSVKQAGDCECEPGYTMQLCWGSSQCVPMGAMC